MPVGGGGEGERDFQVVQVASTTACQHFSASTMQGYYLGLQASGHYEPLSLYDSLYEPNRVRLPVRARAWSREKLVFIGTCSLTTAPVGP